MEPGAEETPFHADHDGGEVEGLSDLREGEPGAGSEEQDQRLLRITLGKPDQGLPMPQSKIFVLFLIQCQTPE